MRPRARNQAGFSIMIVVVLLVLLATIGGFLATTGTVPHVAAALSQAGVQGWFAARSGLEWAVFDALDSGSCPSASFQPPGSAFAGLNVAISCNFSSVSEGSNVYNVYVITATATRGSAGAPDRASRTIRAKITNAP